MNRRSVNLNLNSLPRTCGRCGGQKTVVRTPGSVKVYCAKCDGEK